MNKRQTALLCFLTDVGLSLWSYFKFTNYDEYVKSVRPYLASPDFQIQLYQVLLQSLTFSILLYLGFHIVVYWLYSKGKPWAVKYVRIYSSLAALSCFMMIVSQLWAGILPLVIYSWVFVQSRKAVAEIGTKG